MNWLLVVLAGSVLIDAAVETVASRRVSIPRALSFVRFGLKWLNCSGVLVCVGWFWLRLMSDDVSYSRWATGAAGLVAVVAIWGVVAFVASGPKSEGRAMGALVPHRAVRLTPHYARLAALIFLVAVVLGGGPDESGALLFLMFGLVLSSSLERPADPNVGTLRDEARN